MFVLYSNKIKKLLSNILLVSFLLSSVNISYAAEKPSRNNSTLLPPSGFKPIATVEKNDESYAVVERSEDGPDPVQVEDNTFLYLSGLVGYALHADTSQSDLRDRVKTLQSHINFMRFDPSFVIKLGTGDKASYYLPYRRKDTGEQQYLRYFIPKEEALPSNVISMNEGSMKLAMEVVGQEELPEDALIDIEPQQSAANSGTSSLERSSSFDLLKDPPLILFLLEREHGIDSAGIAMILFDGLANDFVLSEDDLAKIESAKKRVRSFRSDSEDKKAFQEEFERVLKGDLALDSRILRKKDGIPDTAVDKYIMALGGIFREGDVAPKAEPFIKNIVNSFFSDSYADGINITSPARSYHLWNDSAVAYWKEKSYLYRPRRSIFKKYPWEDVIKKSKNKLAIQKIRRAFDIAGQAVRKGNTLLDQSDLKKLREIVTIVEVDSPLPVLLIDPSTKVVRPVSNGRRRQVLYIPRLFLEDFDIKNTEDMSELAFYLIYMLEWNNMHQKLLKTKTSPEDIYSSLNNLTDRFTKEDRYGLARPAQIRQRLFKLMKKTLVLQSTLLVPKLLSEYEGTSRKAVELEKKHPNGYVYSEKGFNKVRRRYMLVARDFASLGLYFDLLGMHELGRRFFLERDKYLRIVQRCDIGMFPGNIQMELLLFYLRHGETGEFLKNFDMFLTGKNFPFSPDYGEHDRRLQFNYLKDVAGINLPFLEREIDYVLDSFERIEKDPAKRREINYVHAMATNMIKDFKANHPYVQKYFAVSPEERTKPRRQAPPGSILGVFNFLLKAEHPLTSGEIAKGLERSGETLAPDIRALRDYFGLISRYTDGGEERLTLTEESRAMASSIIPILEDLYFYYGSRPPLSAIIKARPRIEAALKDDYIMLKGLIDSTYSILRSTEERMRREENMETIEFLNDKRDKILTYLSVHLAVSPHLEEDALEFASMVRFPQDREDAIEQVLSLMAERPASAQKAYRYSVVMLTEPANLAKIYSKTASRMKRDKSIKADSAKDIFNDALFLASLIEDNSRALVIGDILIDLARCGMLEEIPVQIETELEHIKEEDPLRAAVTCASICPELVKLSPKIAKEWWIKFYPGKDLKVKDPNRYAVTLIDMATAIADVGPVGLDGKFFNDAKLLLIRDAINTAAELEKGKKEKDRENAVNIYLKCALAVQKLGMREESVRRYISSAGGAILTLTDRELFLHRSIEMLDTMMNLGFLKEKAYGSMLGKLMDTARVYALDRDSEYASDFLIKAAGMAAARKGSRPQALASAQKIEDPDLRAQANCVIMGEILKGLNGDIPKERLDAIVRPRARTADAKETPLGREAEIATRFVDAIKMAAYKAKKNEQKILIGLETSGWIPDAQRGVMQPLISGIFRLKEDLAKKGSDNIVLVRGEGDDLAVNIKSDAANAEVLPENMVILASEATLRSEAFNDLRSSEKEDRAFFAAIDPKNISDLSYIRLLELLTIAMKLAFRDAYTLANNSNITVEQLGRRIARLIPLAESNARELNELKDRYTIQRKELDAAA